MQRAEKVKPALSDRVFRQRFISSITFTSSKTQMSLLDTSRLPESFWRFSARGKKRPVLHLFTLYLLHRDATH